VIPEVAEIAACDDHLTAAWIRNRVALAAMRGERPESDADECRRAFFARFSDSLIEQHRQAVVDTRYWGE